MRFTNTLIIVILLIMPSIQPFSCKSFMTYRSQGSHPERINDFYFPDQRRSEGIIATGYSRSFNKGAINNYFFGSDNITFSGSRIASRGSSDILADYFGLPSDFKSNLTFNPSVQNFITDLQYTVNLEAVCENLFLTIYAPVVHTTWSLKPCETVIDAGTSPYPAGYLSNERIDREQLPTNALDVLRDQKTFGDLKQPLRYGRIKNRQSSFKVADLKVVLDHQWCNNDQKMLSTSLQFVIPCGTKSKAISIFEPQIGNGHHWAVGAGISGRYTFFQRHSSHISAIFDGELRHLFASTQLRSYDLKKNGAGSRYMLVQDMITRVSITQGFSAALPPFPLLDHQYITRLSYAVDATTLPSQIKIDIEANFIAKFQANFRNWDADLGYNVWFRSSEKLIKRDSLKPESYGIKGDAQLYGFLDIGAFVIPIPGNATQSHATLYHGQGNGNTTDNFVNNNADNTALMYNSGAPLAQTDPSNFAGTGVTSVAQINGSNQSIILTDCDINNNSGLSSKALSHTVFGSIGHSWETQDAATFSLNIGAEGEFAQSFDGRKNAISQWNTWIKGTLTY